MNIKNIMHNTDLDRELQIWQKEKHKASQIGASQNEKKIKKCCVCVVVQLQL